MLMFAIVVQLALMWQLLISFLHIWHMGGKSWLDWCWTCAFFFVVLKLLHLLEHTILVSCGHWLQDVSKNGLFRHLAMASSATLAKASSATSAVSRSDGTLHTTTHCGCPQLGLDSNRHSKPQWQLCNQLDRCFRHPNSSLSVGAESTKRIVAKI